jgi:hypothetical protein
MYAAEIDEQPHIVENNENNAVEDNIDFDHAEGLYAIIEDNIVSDEDDIVDTDADKEDDESTDAEAQEEKHEDENMALVVNIDDNVDAIPSNDRPRRSNAGAGIERIQMDFSGKGYGAKREFNFITNGINTKCKVKEHDTISLMKIACDVIFTQMSVNAGIKKHGEAAVAAMIKKYTQLNEGAVPGHQ